MSRLLPLLEVDDRRAGAEVVAGVLAGDRVDRIRPQLAAPRRLGHRLADLLLHPDLVGADRHLDLEGRHAGVLADRPLARRRLIDVLRDDRQRLAAAGLRRLGGERRAHRRAHVGRQIGRGPGDELDHAVEEVRKHPSSIIDGAGLHPAPHAMPSTEPSNPLASRRFRIERDPLGELRVPADALLRRADAARGRELSDQRADGARPSWSPPPC